MAGRRNGGDYGAGGDFRRRQANDDSVDEQEETPAARRANEYARSLLAEKLAIDQEKHPLAFKLLDQEITKAQSEGRGPKRDEKYVDVYHDKLTKVYAKVLVPLKEHPKFNFVGKLLGPKGNSLKRLQEDTMCRMAILGRGSVRDRDKEEELRNSLDLKYAHLSDDLHVEISALGPPAEAYARVACALIEIQKYLVPDGTDEISVGQLREMEIYEERPPGPKGRPGPPGGPRHPGMRGGPPSRSPGGPPHAASRMPPPGPRGMAGKSNVMSILNRARGAMDDSYEASYEEPYEPESSYNDDFSPSGPSRSGYGGGNRFGASDYDSEYYPDDRNEYEDNENQRWRPYKASGSGGGAPGRPEQPRYRSAPYSRVGK